MVVLCSWPVSALPESTIQIKAAAGPKVHNNCWHRQKLLLSYIDVEGKCLHLPTVDILWSSSRYLRYSHSDAQSIANHRG